VEEIVPRATVLTPNLPEARALTGLVLPADAADAGGRAGRAAVARAGEERTEGGAREPANAPAADGDVEDTDARELARAVLALGPRVVVLTGGHRTRAVDLYLDSESEGGAVDGEREGWGSGGPESGGRGSRGQRSEGRESRGGERVVEIEGERHADGAAHGSGCTHSAVLAAALALGQTPLQAARTARRLAGEAVARGLRDIGAGAGPVDVLGLERLRSAIIEGR
jgi:hydroxymethylpyrimidine/phosphomethylpyrimidine kinase